MAKILFLPVGIGLAHTGRLMAIAKAVQKRKIEVLFGAGSEALELLKSEGFEYKVLPDFDRRVYDEKIKKNNPSVYTRESFKRFVKAELDLYKKINPDLVVYDMRLSAKVSAKIAGIPTVSVTNADVTPYYDWGKVKFPFQTHFKALPSLARTLLDKGYGYKILSFIGPQIIKAKILKEIIKLLPVLVKYGYKLSPDPYQFFLGDLTLIADIPEFRPIKDLPENVKIVGPIFWDGVEKLPSWAERISDLSNIIYVTASGTGDKEIFFKILEYLKDSGMTIVATTGNTLKPQDVDITYSNLYLTDYLPGKFVMSRAHLIIFPGGNATAYQSLKYGVPQIGTPLHIDQEDNINQLVRLGTGVMLLPDKTFQKARLIEAIEEILNDPKYKKNSQKISLIMKEYHGAERGADEIVKFLKKTQSG